MARLSKVTRASVEEALIFFQSPEGKAELERSRFRDSKFYFLRHDGKLFDTKPLVAAAYGFAVPEEGPLTPKNFSGGAEHSAKRLNRLGFDIVTTAMLNPPKLGDQYLNRTKIASRYGGNRVPGIVRFPGESVVNVFSDADGPYLDDPPSLTAPFVYRGEGLNGPQNINSQGNQLLEKSRLNKLPTRYWYRPLGGQFTFVSWVAVLGRAWDIGLGDDGLKRPEVAWQLQAVGSTDHEDWPMEVVSAAEDAAKDPADADADVPEVRLEPTYADLLRRVETAGQSRRPDGSIRVSYFRSTAARRAVLVRSEGRCESERCTGMPADLNRLGEAILDVDHIEDLSLGGEDHPRNMVALCPNCHAAKTRGAHAARWRRELKKIALTAHRRMEGRSGTAVS